MKRTRNLFVGAGFLALLAALAVVQTMLQRTAAAQAQGAAQAPRFEVDPTFPKPLPDGPPPEYEPPRSFELPGAAGKKPSGESAAPAPGPPPAAPTAVPLPPG